MIITFRILLNTHAFASAVCNCFITFNIFLLHHSFISGVSSRPSKWTVVRKQLPHKKIKNPATPTRVSVQPKDGSTGGDNLCPRITHFTRLPRLQTFGNLVQSDEMSPTDSHGRSNYSLI